MPYTVRIDKDLCISSGRCLADAPNAFSFDEDELAEAQPSAGELERSRLFAIARQCPGGAIRVLDDDGSVLAP